MKFLLLILIAALALALSGCEATGRAEPEEHCYPGLYPAEYYFWSH